MAKVRELYPSKQNSIFHDQLVTLSDLDAFKTEILLRIRQLLNENITLIMTEIKDKRKDFELKKEFTRLGFDYQEMVRSSAIDNPFISFSTKIDKIKFRNSKYKIEFTFLAYNPSINEHIKLLAMNVGLFRYSPDFEKAERLAENVYWYTEGAFPTKEHVLNENLKSIDVITSNRITKATEVFEKMNTIKQDNQKTLKNNNKQKP
jgi:hypothetical protein